MRRRRSLSAGSDEIDLVPLIDCVFLILLFFILCGHLSTDQRPEQISVPPGRTAQALINAPERIVLSLRGGERPALAFGNADGWIDLAEGWALVRQRLDAIWERAGKRQRDGHTIADAVLEVRADAELPYHLVQELQQIAADVIDPDTMMTGPRTQRSFVNIDFLSCAARVSPPGTARRWRAALEALPRARQRRAVPGGYSGTTSQRFDPSLHTRSSTSPLARRSCWTAALASATGRRSTSVMTMPGRRPARSAREPGSIWVIRAPWILAGISACWRICGERSWSMTPMRPPSSP